ncbi:MAG: PKD domain-containing protein [Syntrophobacteraceae bacterium]
MSTVLCCITFLFCLLAVAVEAEAIPVKFQWNASTGSVAGYKIYQGIQSGAYLSSATFPGTGTSGTMDLDPSASRYVAAKAYDSSQRESAFSNEILCHPVTVSASAGGTISPGGTFFVQDGGNVTFTLSASSGYQVSSLLINGRSVGSATSYTMTGVTGISTVTATFAPGPANTFTISVASPTNGSISPSGTVPVSPGGSRTFTITPSTGYSIQDVIVDGTSVGAVSRYSFTDVRASHTLAAVFIPSVNQPPVADAGPDQTVQAGRIVRLDGTRSSDADNGIASYNWVRLSGPSVALSKSTTASPTFTAPDVSADGTALTFGLTVTDRAGLTATDTCIVNVSSTNQPPSANPGPSTTVAEQVMVELDGSESTDPDDGIVSYQWAKISGPRITLANASSAIASFIAPDVGPAGTSFTFQLTVRDKGGLRSSAQKIVNVTWVNAPPDAQAGPDRTVSQGEAVTLDGSESTDPDDGIVSHRWTQVSGPPATLLTAASNPVVTFGAPDSGTTGTALTFQLTVTDAGGLQSSDSCVISVSDLVGPDLSAAWKSFTYSDPVASGSLEIRNTGSLPSKNTSVAFYLSTDGSTPAKLISRKAVRSLPAGQARDLKVRVRRTGLQSQYIVAVVDYLERVAETSESNNQAPVVVP